MVDDLYKDALYQDGRNLSRLALDKNIALPLDREEQISAVLASIGRNRSVMLVGDAGVGKTAILHGVAAQLPGVARELWELAATSVLTNTRYLGDWQSKVASVLKTLKSKRGVLYFTDVWNVLTIGSTDTDRASLFDYLRPKMQAGELQLIGEVTPDRFQVLQRAPLLTSLFDVVHVAPLAESQIARIHARPGDPRMVSRADHRAGTCDRIRRRSDHPVQGRTARSCAPHRHAAFRQADGCRQDRVGESTFEIPVRR
jgi:ATP-dependent Clp protease ATP-binding subunit ClpA